MTTLAILLGVAMVTGTYVLTEQINNAFSNIFETSFKGTAVQVEPERSFTSLEGDAPQTLNDDLVAQVLAVPGVDKAARIYRTIGAAIVDGKAVESGGSPTLLTTGDLGEPFNQATLVAGREIQGRDEVRPSRASPTRPASSLGESFTVAAPSGLQEVTVAGVFEWGDSGSLGAHHRRRRPPARRAALGRRARQAQRHLRLRRSRRDTRGARART